MSTTGPVAIDRAEPRGVGASAAFSVLAGLASAIPIGRASRRTNRRVAAVSAVAGGAAAAGLTAGAASAERDAAADGPAAPPTVRQAVGPALAGVLAGGGMFGVVVLSVAIDRRLEAILVRRGVQRPRLALGIASGVVSFAMDRLDSRVHRRVESPVRDR